MKILILFAIITLVLFLILISMNQDVLTSIVISVLCGTIFSYFLNNLRLDLSYKIKDKDNVNNDKDRDHNRDRDNVHSSSSSNSNSNSRTSSEYYKTSSLLH